MTAPRSHVEISGDSGETSWSHDAPESNATTRVYEQPADVVNERAMANRRIPVRKGHAVATTRVWSVFRATYLPFQAGTAACAGTLPQISDAGNLPEV